MERKRKNLPRQYKALKAFWCCFLTGMMLCCSSLALSAQSKKITAIYDAEKGELTIVNRENICTIVTSSDMPSAFIDHFGSIDTIALDNDPEIVKVSSEEMKNISELTVYFQDSELNFTKPYVIQIQFKNMPDAEEEIDEVAKTPFYVKWISLGKSVIYFASGGLLLLLGLVVLLVFLRRKRKGGDADNEDKPHVMQVVEEEKNDFEIGLGYVREHPEQYYTVNMEDFCLDTAVKKVYFSREAVKSLNSYYKTFLEQPERTNETGCYLIGGWETVDGNDELYNVSVEEMVIPGDDAVYDEYSLNFGLKIGIKLGSSIRNLCEKTGRDYVHTAWMHSHPGLGLFLSSHDLVVQKQLTYPDAPNRMVAIVIDTNTPNWQMAFFTAKSSGVMNNKDDLRKTISFDVLNEWSRHKIAAAQPSVSVENSFIVATEDGRDEFAFSAKAINQMDDAVYAEEPANSHPLYGEILQNGTPKARVVTSCDADTTESRIGLLMVETDTEEAFDAHRYVNQLGEVDFYLVYRSEMECYVVWLNADQKIRFVHTSLKEMKEWTRRKRV